MHVACRKLLAATPKAEIPPNQGLFNKPSALQADQKRPDARRVTGTRREVQGARKKQQREILETSTLKTVYRVP